MSLLGRIRNMLVKVKIMMDKISKREKEILILVAYEKTTDEIASALFISSHTAISHRKNIMNKLKVKNTAGMVRRAFELGILSLNESIRGIQH